MFHKEYIKYIFHKTHIKITKKYKKWEDKYIKF